MEEKLLKQAHGTVNVPCVHAAGVSSCAVTNLLLAVTGQAPDSQDAFNFRLTAVRADRNYDKAALNTKLLEAQGAPGLQVGRQADRQRFMHPFAMPGGCYKMEWPGVTRVFACLALFANPGTCKRGNPC